MEKRLLFLCGANFWSIAQGKGAPSLFLTVDGYVKNGWTVYALMSTKDHNYGPVPENLHITCIDYPRLRRLSLVENWGYPFRMLLWRLNNRKFYSLGRRIIEEHGVDLVYAYEVEGVPAAARLAARYHKPLVTRFMGTILYGKLNDLRTKISHWKHFVALRQKADAVIMTNDGTKGDCVLAGLKNQTERVYFWMNGVNRIDPEQYDRAEIRRSLGIPDSCAVLLCVSRLVWWKRVERSIHSFHKLMQKQGAGGDARLVIVGDGDSKPALMQLAEQLGLSDKVIFTGGIPQREVYRYMVAADVFLSLYDLSNMGNPLFEAMRCGKAVVTLANGDTPRLIENGVTGILVDPYSDDAVAEVLGRLLSDANEIARLGENTRLYAESHFWTWEERIAEEQRVVGKLAEDFRSGRA